MNRYVLLVITCAVGLTVVCVLTACGRPFAAAQDKNWQLIEVRANPDTLIFERGSLTEERFRDFFTLRFDGKNVSGIGAPNRYSAPYTLEGGRSIRIDDVRSTLMAALYEPEQLKEQVYFSYLKNSVSWNFAGKNLELRTRGADEAEIVLVFAQRLSNPAD